MLTQMSATQSMTPWMNPAQIADRVGSESSTKPGVATAQARGEQAAAPAPSQCTARWQRGGRRPLGAGANVYNATEPAKCSGAGSGERRYDDNVRHICLIWPECVKVDDARCHGLAAQGTEPGASWPPLLAGRWTRLSWPRGKGKQTKTVAISALLQGSGTSAPDNEAALALPAGRAQRAVFGFD